MKGVKESVNTIKSLYQKLVRVYEESALAWFFLIIIQILIIFMQRRWVIIPEKTSLIENMNLVSLLCVQALGQDKVGCENMMPGNARTICQWASLEWVEWEEKWQKRRSSRAFKVAGYGVLLAQRQQMLSLIVLINIFNSTKHGFSV